MKAWRAWVALWDREEPPHALAAVRIGVGLVLLYDLLRILSLGLVVPLFAPAEAGGFPDIDDRMVVPELYRLFPRSAATAWGAWGVATAAALAVATGTFTRSAALVLMLVSAQLAQITPLADRGIDLLLRDVLAVLACSGAGAVWSVDARLGGARPTVPAWPRHLLVLQLLVVYAMAGVQKTALAWTPFGGFSALYVVLQDPSIARHDFGWLGGVYPLTQVATAATMVFEWSALALPLAWWFRATRDRPGRLRAWFNRVEPVRAWALVGVALHLGIAATMALGIFPFAMLALYPALFHPDEWGRTLRFRARARAPG